MAVGELTPVSTVPVPWALLAVIVMVAASPLLAGWTVALADGVALRWWRPRAVRWPDVVAVATVAIALAVAASPAKPRAAWLLLAAGGAVLCVVDVRTLRLPVRLTITIAAAELATLAVAALLDRDPARLLRAVEAAGAVAAPWFCLVLAAPSSLGLGDVWVAGVCAGLLGCWAGRRCWRGRPPLGFSRCRWRPRSLSPGRLTAAAACRCRWGRRSSPARSWRRRGCDPPRPTGRHQLPGGRASRASDHIRDDRCCRRGAGHGRAASGPRSRGGSCRGGSRPVTWPQQSGWRRWRVSTWRADQMGRVMGDGRHRTQATPDRGASRARAGRGSGACS